MFNRKEDAEVTEEGTKKKRSEKESKKRKAFSVVKKERKKKKRDSSPLDVMDMKATIFSSGLSKENAKKVIVHILEIKPYCEASKTTKHRNFVRNLINLVVYVYYCNEYRKLYLEDMSDNGVGYVNQFERTRPNQNDVLYKKIMSEVMIEVGSEPSWTEYPWNPKVEDVMKWSGNMNNYIYIQMRNAYHKGVFTDEEEEIDGGMYQGWKELLESLGIEFEDE